MARCPECGTERYTGRFCGHCGAALPSGRLASRAPDGGDGSELATNSTPSRRRWTAGAVVAVAVGIAVAFQGSSGDRSAPDQGRAQPTSASASPQSGPPPLPTTVPESCPDEVVGCVLWRTDLTDATSITVPVAGRDPRHAYLGAVLPDGGGALYAIDPANGIQLWRRRLPGPPRAPTVTPWGAVVVAYDDPRAGSGLRSYNPDTGELGWQAEGALAGRTTAGPVVAGRTVASAGPRQLMLHHQDTGAVTLIEVDGTPAAMLGGGDGDAATFLVLMDDGVRAYATDGSTRWTATASTMGTAMPDGRTVLVEPPDQVVGIAGARGEVWRRTIDILAIPPVVAGSEAVLSAPDGSLIRLSLEDGTDLGRVDLEEGLVSGPFTIDGGTAFLPTCGGVTAITLATGEEVFATGLPSGPAACGDLPTVVPGEGGPLLVGTGTRLHGLIRASSVP